MAAYNLVVVSALSVVLAMSDSGVVVIVANLVIAVLEAMQCDTYGGIRSYIIFS